MFKFCQFSSDAVRGEPKKVRCRRQTVLALYHYRPCTIVVLVEQSIGWGCLCVRTTAFERNDPRGRMLDLEKIFRSCCATVGHLSSCCRARAGRPLQVTVRPMLPMSCPVLSVCNVSVLWPNGWMNQDVTWYGPGDIGLDRDPAPLHRKWHSSPHFSAHAYCGQTVAHLSNCWALAWLVAVLISTDNITWLRTGVNV